MTFVGTGSAPHIAAALAACTRDLAIAQSTLKLMSNDHSEALRAFDRRQLQVCTGTAPPTQPTN